MRDLIDIIEDVDAAPECRVYHVTPRRNLPRIRREGLHPKRGARSRSAGETREAIYVFPDWLSLEDGLSNWLGDAFDDSVSLSILELTVPAGWVTQDQLRWEATITQPVPPDRIRVVVDDVDTHDGKPPANAVFPEDP